MDEKVLSFNPTKIRISTQNGKTRVFKKTKAAEYANLQAARRYIDSAGLGCNGYLIKVVGGSHWNQAAGELEMDLVAGENLETLVKGPRREQIVALLESFIGLVKTHGFLWGEIAPRNMILNEPQKTVTLVDFEKPLSIHGRSIDDYAFYRFLSMYAREELSAFLLPDEFNRVLGKHLRPPDASRTTDTSAIGSSRKRHLLSHFFGAQARYNDCQLNHVEGVMAAAIAPRVKDGKIIAYPAYQIDAASCLGVEKYLSLVLNFAEGNKHDGSKGVGCVEEP